MSNLSLLILYISSALCVVANPPSNRWIEYDTECAIEQRTRADFSLPYAQGVQEIQHQHPGVSVSDVKKMVDDKYIETMDFDGNTYMFVRTARNLNLLNPAYNRGWTHRGYDASPMRIAFADSIIRHSQGALPKGGAHRVRINFSIVVPYIPDLKNDTLRVWMPYPIESPRQYDILLIGASQNDYIISSPGQSMHRTIYMEKPVTTGKSTNFDYTVEFSTSGQYFSPEFIKANIIEYDKSSPEYKKYTSFEGQHYIKLDSLARSIVGNETNPYRQSEMVYDYIINHYPWASARDYSTIPCIPQYVIDQRHGDCGQVALLYISLMRTLGVPARWESGWMLHPFELNYHDWAEVYFEGVGWVPIDVSFGRYSTSGNPAIRNFYSTGIDSWRFATNTGICGDLYPQKQYVRSETVDFQAGEVECSKGNLYYPLWKKNFKIISAKPIEK